VILKYSLLILLILLVAAGAKQGLIGFLVDLGADKSRLRQLELENEKLRAQIWQLENKLPLPVKEVLRGQIHSSYPFNNKNLLSINLGRVQGAAVGMPVTIDGHILIGQISEVFKNYSLVRTIFSPDWELPVRIGPRKVPALLVGGPSPKLKMISQDRKVSEGEVVFSVSQDLPLGLKIGEVTAIESDQATGIFKEASVKLGYEINDLTELIILPWTAD